MKRSVIGLIVLSILLLLPVLTLADADRFCDEMPRDVRALEEQENPDGVFSDCIVIQTPTGDVCWVLSPWTLNGYRLEQGAWQIYAQAQPMAQENAPALFFRRHAAGQTYPDALGFDIVRGDPAGAERDWDILHLHWKDGDFALTGWQKKQSGQFAILLEDQWAFFDSLSTEKLGSARIGSLFSHGVGARFDDLPGTLEEARGMEAITEEAAKSLFPGWTMTCYDGYNSGHGADVGYCRVDDGWLTIRRVTLESDAGGIAAQTDTMPLLLSQDLLARLQAEPMDALVDTGGYGDTFLTENFWDADTFPIAGKVLQNDLQTHGLLLLTEDEGGNRFLVWITPSDGNGYAFHTSGALPKDTYLDLFHAGDDSVFLEWDSQDMQCSASLAADGTWIPESIAHYTENDSMLFSIVYCGIFDYDLDEYTMRLHVGSHPWLDLFRMDVASLPRDYTALHAQLDRDGWAVVGNPDPADRLHLRAKPDRDSASLGKFYNGTPVQTLKQKGDWTQVRIGLDGRLEGWMLTKYLTSGEAMDDIASAWPYRILRDEHIDCKLFSSPDLKETTGVAFGKGTTRIWIVGVVGEEWYILLDEHGNTGYLPQSWLWEGNG